MQGEPSIKQPDAGADIPEPVVAQLGKCGLQLVSLEWYSVKLL
jgi:hypothetical protein